MDRNQFLQWLPQRMPPPMPTMQRTPHGGVVFNAPDFSQSLGFLTDSLSRFDTMAQQQLAKQERDRAFGLERERFDFDRQMEMRRFDREGQQHEAQVAEKKAEQERERRKDWETRVAPALFELQKLGVPIDEYERHYGFTMPKLPKLGPRLPGDGEAFGRIDLMRPIEKPRTNYVEMSPTLRGRVDRPPVLDHFGLEREFDQLSGFNPFAGPPTDEYRRERSRWVRAEKLRRTGEWADEQDGDVTLRTGDEDPKPRTPHRNLSAEAETLRKFLERNPGVSVEEARRSLGLDLPTVPGAGPAALTPQQQALVDAFLKE